MEHRMNVLIDEFIPLDQWNQLVSESSHSSPFQTHEFYSLCNSVLGFRAKAVAVCNTGRILALVVVVIQHEPGLKSFLSRRGIIYGGPLVRERMDETLDLLLSETIFLLKGTVIYFESRNFSDYSDYNQIFLKNGWTFVPYLNLTINLDGKTLLDIMSGMNYNRRRQIRLSLESEAIYRECESETELKGIYDILKSFYRVKLKLPLPDFQFFEALWLKKPGKVFVVLHNNKVIGGSFCLVLTGRSIYTMYYCGLRDYDRKIYPTHLAVLAALDYAVSSGLKLFDFMGAGNKNKEYGVRTYKQEFGSTLNEYGRYIRVVNRILYIMGSIAMKIPRLSLR